MRSHDDWRIFYFGGMDIPRPSPIRPDALRDLLTGKVPATGVLKDKHGYIFKVKEISGCKI